MTFSDAPLAVVLVTFNRAEMLTRALDSLDASRRQPDLVVIVDNASTDDTPKVISHWQSTTKLNARLVRCETNTGGAGGFARGVREALDAGTEWIFVMDDDVELMPHAFDDLAPYTARFTCLQGRRLDPASGFERWQPYVTKYSWLPFRRLPEFDATGAASVNSGIFEGMLFHRSVPERVGVPDERFFIASDDVAFARSASRHAPVGYVDAVTLRKQPRHVRVDVGERSIMKASDMHRFYIVRNRKLLAEYARAEGTYCAPLFTAGTFITAGKEVVRLVLTRQPLSRAAVVARALRQTWA